MLRALSRRRVLVLTVALVAVVAGVGAFVASPTNKVGVAHSMALVDTPHSQVVDLGSVSTVASIGTLSSRATLLTGLMTSSPLKDEIAARAGISTRNLIAVSAATQMTASGSGAPATPSLLANATTGVSPQMNVLTATVPDLATGQVPMITVDTQSPSAAGAAKLANSSIEVLSQYLQSLAAQDKVPGARRVIVRQLGPATASTTINGPAKVLGVGVAVLVFVLGCALIIGASALKAGWRRAGEMEELVAAGHPSAPRPLITTQAFKRASGPDRRDHTGPPARLLRAYGPRDRAPASEAPTSDERESPADDANPHSRNGAPHSDGAGGAWADSQAASETRAGP